MPVLHRFLLATSGRAAQDHVGRRNATPAPAAMHKFKCTTVGGDDERPLTPADVSSLLQSIQTRPTWQGIIISPDTAPGPDGAGQYPVVYLAWYPDYGFELQLMELPGDNNFLASSEKLSKPEVYVELGGQGQELWPRELFVSLYAASQALRTVLQSGCRDNSLPWVAIDAFPRLKVAPRDRSNRAQ